MTQDTAAIQIGLIIGDLRARVEVLEQAQEKIVELMMRFLDHLEASVPKEEEGQSTTWDERHPGEAASITYKAGWVDGWNEATDHYAPASPPPAPALPDWLDATLFDSDGKRVVAVMKKSTGEILQEHAVGDPPAPAAPSIALPPLANRCNEVHPEYKTRCTLPHDYDPTYHHDGEVGWRTAPAAAVEERTHLEAVDEDHTRYVRVQDEPPAPGPPRECQHVGLLPPKGWTAWTTACIKCGEDVVIEAIPQSTEAEQV